MKEKNFWISNLQKNIDDNVKHWQSHEFLVKTHEVEKFSKFSNFWEDVRSLNSHKQVQLLTIVLPNAKPWLREWHWVRGKAEKTRTDR